VIDPERENVSSPSQHPLFARIYPRLARAMEHRGGADHRRWLLAGLGGHVVEVGAGNGLNFAHYPRQVVSVLAIEPEPRLRELAQREAGRAAVPIEVVDGVAEHLPAEDATLDAAVVSLVLCSVEDQRAALAEIHRVLRPGAELRFFEHVVSLGPVAARTQRFLDAMIWPTVGAGCHAGRDTAAAIVASGFELEYIDRFRFPRGGIPTPTAPHILGVATRP
jgi:ubiquinone/menaquinone biosynthesis C-methylase UbiE